ncbi:MAG: hypothetical protein BJ554DRAFT_2890 [Olpidium bornovanus]|uniref:Uncharacterized protein n=1 Tax=Olpidium bornovanus TaxID=278681 RepID=A0A8H8A0H9_9FUNG|nr:MAG: hypothetical protein BJ554DRAFT_2890 [Olpidium bornovanus]
MSFATFQSRDSLYREDPHGLFRRVANRLFLVRQNICFGLGPPGAPPQEAASKSGSQEVFGNISARSLGATPDPWGVWFSS